MDKIFFLIIAIASFQISESSGASTADTISVSPFGRVYVYKPQGTPENVVIMISGDAGWKFGVVSFAEEFSKMNNIVIGIDIIAYFRDLRKRPDECYHVAADFVELATSIEKKYNFPEYRPALIMGYSSGATLVYGILAQSRADTFIGGISLGFCPDIELPKMLCETNGLAEKVDQTGKSYFLQPDARLGNPWIVLHGKLDKVCNYSETVEFVNKTRDAELVTLTETGHGFAKWSNFMPQWKDACQRLITGYDKRLAQKGQVETKSTVEKSTGADTKAASEIKVASDLKISTESKVMVKPKVNFDRIRHLPLSVTKSKTESPEEPVALLISGDGGWYSFEQSIADNLSAMGIPTVGLDSKKYFWKRRTPEETTEDIAMALNYYSQEWGRNKFILIGYSLGSEIVPFIINRVSLEMKSKIVSAVLLSPDISTDFEIHISNMLGMGNRQNTYNVTDEIGKMQSVHTLIIFGSGEKTEVPDLLAGTGVTVRKIPGDHHYKFDLPLIIRTMKDNNTF